MEGSQGRKGGMDGGREGGRGFRFRSKGHAVLESGFAGGGLQLRLGHLCLRMYCSERALGSALCCAQGFCLVHDFGPKSFPDFR